MDESALVHELESAGYDKVYIWDAESCEDDPDHAHEFDTTLKILRGEITVTISGHKSILRVGDTFDIPRNVIHAAVVGVDGCRYIVAERH